MVLKQLIWHLLLKTAKIQNPFADDQSVSSAQGLLIAKKMLVKVKSRVLTTYTMKAPKHIVTKP